MIYLISTNQCDYFWYNHEYYFVVYNFENYRCFGINAGEEIHRVHDDDIKKQLINHSSNLTMKDKIIITGNIKGRISQILEDMKLTRIIEKI